MSLIKLFDPKHPHCTLCDGHIDPESDFVLVGLAHPEGDKAIAIMHIACASMDDEIGGLIGVYPIPAKAPHDHLLN